MNETLIEKLIRTNVITERDIQDYINKKGMETKVVDGKNETYSVIKEGVLVKFDKRDLVNGHYTVPKEVQKIGVGAFSYCNELKTISMHNGVERIGNRAFSCSGLRCLIIPQSVKYVGKEICLCCVDLFNVEILAEIQVLNDYAFADCKTLNSVRLPNDVKTISSFAFQGCEELKEITLPDSVRKICATAFIKCYSLQGNNTYKHLKNIGLLNL